MDLEICKRCNRHIVFTLNNDRITYGRREVFRCYKEIDKSYFEYGCLDICCWRLRKGKWKRIGFNLFQTIFLIWDKNKWLNEKFVRYKIEDMIFMEEIFECPYRLEHEIKELNNEFGNM